MLSDIICSALSNHLIQKYCFDRIVDQDINIHSHIPHLSIIIHSEEKNSYGIQCFHDIHSKSNMSSFSHISSSPFLLCKYSHLGYFRFIFSNISVASSSCVFLFIGQALWPNVPSTPGPSFISLFLVLTLFM